jgi:hypothetical protein
MDINKIVTNRSDKRRIHFFRYLKNPTWFLIKSYSDRDACEFILKSWHLPPFEDSGYKDLKVEWAFAINYETAYKDAYLNFLKTKVGNSVLDEDDSINSWIGDNGWYEFKDVSDTDKWLTDYNCFQQENKESIPIVQAVLF